MIVAESVSGKGGQAPSHGPRAQPGSAIRRSARRTSIRDGSFVRPPTALEGLGGGLASTGCRRAKVEEECGVGCELIGWSLAGDGEAFVEVVRRHEAAIDTVAVVALVVNLPSPSPKVPTASGHVASRLIRLADYVSGSATPAGDATLVARTTTTASPERDRL